MLLHDATDRAAVDLFLRNLYFSFPARDAVGIPGGVIGYPKPHEKEEESVLLLHELEHVNSLTFPVGAFFTALATRANDLRNTTITRYNGLMKRQIDTPVPGEGPGDLDLEAAEVALLAGNTAEFGRQVITTCELMAPLLEGLAMAAEMELTESDSSWSLMLVVGLEYNYYEHILLLTNPAAPALLSDSGHIEGFINDLSNALASQLEVSRKRRLQGELIDRMFFWKPTDEHAAARSSYFYGYLFLRRLYQAWRDELPELDFGRFFPIASKLICSVIPMTILPLSSLKDYGDKNIWLTLPVLFKGMLEGFLSLTGEQILLLRDSRRILVWSFDRRTLIPWKSSGGEESEKLTAEENYLLGNFVWHVFDVRDGQGDSALETLELVRDTERAKFLVRTAVRDVLILGVDEETNTLLLADLERLKGADVGEPQRRLGATAATFFRFTDRSLLQQFFDIMGEPARRLKRLRLGNAPYTLAGDTQPIPAQLQTFCHFWPHGVAHTTEGQLTMPGTPVDVTRILICPKDSEFYSFTDGPDLRDLAALLRARDRINDVLLWVIPKVFDPDYKESRFILEEIEAIYADDTAAHIAADLLLKRYPPGQLPFIQSKCRAVYSSLLFPAAGPDTEPDLSRRKFNLLADTLTGEDMKSLRRWFRRGVVVSPSKAFDPTAQPGRTDDERAAVERVREAASRTLGIPLVRWEEDPPRVTLDLKPLSGIQ